MSEPVFTYGTLQVPVVMEAVTGRKFTSSPAILNDYIRYIVKRQVYPGIIPLAGSVVDGRLYFDMDDAAVRILDAFEDVLYERRQVEVNCNNQKIPAQAYVVAEKYRNLLSRENWDIKAFESEQLVNYLDSCRSFHGGYKQS